MEHPLDELNHDIFQFDADLARLKLALLKENFEYREFFRNFADDPYRLPFPAGVFKKFGMPGMRFCCTSPNYKGILNLIDPFKETSLDPRREKSLLSRLFYSHGVKQIEFDDQPVEGIASITKFGIERRGIKPHERALLVDLSKKKKQLLREFSEFIDNVYRHKNYSIMKKDLDFEFYQKMEPDISRFRQESWTHLKVWKLRKNRVRFSQIAMKLGLTEDAAKKSFYRAYELTQNKKYDPDALRREIWLIKKSELKKTCDACDERENCMSLCPEVLAYIDQDTVKNPKEKLYSNIQDLL